MSYQTRCAQRSPSGDPRSHRQTGGPLRRLRSVASKRQREQSRCTASAAPGRYCTRADRGSSMRMNVMRIVVALLGAIAAAMSGSATAQSQTELRAAADRWLSQDVIRIQYASSTGWSSTFEIDLKAGNTNFMGSNDRVCLGSSVPTKVHYVEPELVFDFQPAARGCNPPQYRFNPISGRGKVFITPDGGATRTESPSKVSLKE
jgi:hypothetical protein